MRFFSRNHSLFKALSIALAFVLSVGILSPLEPAAASGNVRVVSGLVLDTSGNRIPWVSVTVSDGQNTIQIKSNHLGFYDATLPIVGRTSAITLTTVKQNYAGGAQSLIYTGTAIDQNIVIAPNDSGSSSISGTVSRDGVALPSRWVQLSCHDQKGIHYDYGALTNESGFYSFAGLPSFTCKVRTHDRLSRYVNLALTGSPVSANLDSETHSSTTVRGVISLQTSGSAERANTWIQLRYDDGRSEGWFSTNTNSDGEYSLTDVPIGSVSVYVPGSGTHFGVNNEIVTLSSALENQLDYLLQPFSSGNGILDVSLTDIDGVPVTSSSLRLTSYISGSSVEFTAPASPSPGRFRFSNLPSGTYDLVASSDTHFTGFIEEISIPISGTVYRGLTLYTRGSNVIEGSVLVSSGQTSRGISVYLKVGVWPHSAQTLSTETVTDGTFRFEGLGRGSYELYTYDPIPLHSYPRSVPLTLTTSSPAVTKRDLTYVPYATGDSSFTFVVSDQANLPISGAQVQLSGYPVNSRAGWRYYFGASSSMGVVRFENLPAGNYYSWIRSSQKLDLSRNLTLGLKQSAEVNLVMKNSGTNAVSVKVLGQNETVVTDAKVSMSLADSAAGSWGSAEFSTNSSGIVEISNVPAGTHLIRVYPPTESGYKHYENQSVVVNSATKQSFEVQLQKYPTGEGKISGLVATVSGTALPNASVSVYSYLQNRQFTTTTNSSGEYQIEGLVDGSYDVRIRKAGYLDTSASVRISGESEEVEDFRMHTQGTSKISGKVSPTDNLTEGIANVRVSAHFYEDGSSWWQSVYTDENGFYELENVPTGRIELSVDADGLPYFNTWSLPVEIEGPGSSEIENLTVESYPTGTASVSGTITTFREGESQPISSINVYLYCYFNAGSVNFRAATDENGYYAFEGLARADNCHMNIWPGSEYLWQNDRLSIPEGAQVTKSFSLAAGGDRTVSGTVVTTTGVPVEGANIQLNYQASDGRWNAWTETDETGAYFVSNLPNHNSSATFELRVFGHSAKTKFFPVDRISLTEEVTRDIVRNIVVEGFPTGDTKLGGEVRDRITGALIPGATIIARFTVSSAEGTASGFDSRRATTNSSGVYEVVGLPSGTVQRVSVSAPSYERSGTKVVSGASGSVLRLDLSMSLTPVGTGSISGKVIDGSTSAAVSRVYMYLQLDGSNSIRRNSYTGSSGNYKFNQLPQGTYTLHAWPQYYSEPIYKYVDLSKRKVVLATSSTQVVNNTVTLVRLPTGNSTVTGQLFDSTTNEAMPGIRGWLSSDEQQVYKDFRTNASGEWSVPKLPEGNYTYYYNLPRSPIYEVPNQRFVEVASANEVVVLTRDLVRSVVPGNSSLKVVVRDRATHLPIPGATVYIAPENLSGGYSERLTPASGEVEFRNLVLAKYHVYIWTPDEYVNPSRAVVFDLNQGTNFMSIRLEKLDRTGVVTGIVLDNLGKPMPNLRVAATLEVLGEEGVSDGNYFYSFTRTDELGQYRLDRVPLNREVDFSIRYSGRSGSDGGFAPYVERMTVTGATIRNVNLSPGATISGQVTGHSGFGVAAAAGEFQANLAGMKVQIVDAITRAWRGEARIQSDGTYTVPNLPAGSFKVFFSDDSWEQSSNRPRFGYYTGIFIDDPNVPDFYRLRAEFTAGTTISVAAGESKTLSIVPIEVGGSISGAVKVDIAGTLTDFYHRWIEVNVERQVVGSNPAVWETYSGLNYFYASGYEGGKFRVDGLPNGTYRLKFSEPWFGSTKLETKYSPSILLSGLQQITVVPVVMEVSEPLGIPNYVELSDISEQSRQVLRDQVQVATAVAPSSDIVVDVGMEFAGEWVAATVDLSATQAPSNSISSASRGSFGLFASSLNILSPSSSSSTSTVARQDWYQVLPNGTISLPGSRNLGKITVVIQDSRDQVIGWAESRIGNTGAGGGGGFGGGAFGPMGPEVKDTSPIISGKLQVKLKVTVTKGDLALLPGKVKFKYQWYRCLFPSLKSDIKPVGCFSIKGATKKALFLKKRDLNKYMVARITAASPRESTTLWTASSGQVAPAKKLKK